jgi:hypothetical protein
LLSFFSNLLEIFCESLDLHEKIDLLPVKGSHFVDVALSIFIDFFPKLLDFLIVVLLTLGSDGLQLLKLVFRSSEEKVSTLRQHFSHKFQIDKFTVG